MYLSVKNEIPNYNEALAEAYGFYNFTGLYTKGEYDEYGYLICYMWGVGIFSYERIFKKLIVGVLLFLCIGVNFEKVILLQMNGVSRLSFIIVTETVQFLKLQTYMMEIFISVQPEIHLLQEQNIGQ